MIRHRKFALRITTAFGVLLLLGVGGWFYLNWSLGRSLRTVDFAPFFTVIEKAGSDLVVMRQLRPSQPHLPRGYLVAYEENPEGFKGDAKLFETWVYAMSLTTSVLQNGPDGNWVKNSSDLESAKPGSHLDPWQHPFCLLRRDDAVLAISAGPNAPGSPACNNIAMTEQDLATFSQKKLLESPSGSLVLVITKNSIRAPQTSRQ